MSASASKVVLITPSGKVFEKGHALAGATRLIRRCRVGGHWGRYCFDKTATVTDGRAVFQRNGKLEDLN